MLRGRGLTRVPPPSRAVRIGNRVPARLTGLIVGIILQVAADHAAAVSPKPVLLLPLALEGEAASRPWLSPAVTEALKNLHQSLGGSFIPSAEGPRELRPPGRDVPSTEEVSRWLGPALWGRAGAVVLGSLALAGDQVDLRLAAYGSGLEERLENRFGGQVNRLPSLILKAEDFLLEATGLSVSRERREQIFRGLTSSGEALAAYGESFLAPDPPTRLRRLEEALAKDGAFSLARMQLGLLEFAQGRRGEARDHFIRVVRETPYLKEAHNNLGVILSEEGDLRGAAEAFGQALRVDERYFEARFNLAKLLDRERRTQDAVEEYRRLLGQEPGRDDIRFMLALALDRLRQPERALEEFRTLSARDPSMAEGFFLRKGQEARQDRRFQDAEAFLRRALDIKPDMGEAYRDLGITLLLAGDHAKSARYFVQAAERLPDSAEIQHYLGLARSRAGQAEEALRSFQRSIELGSVPKSNLEAGRILLAQGRQAEAVEYLNRYLKLSPEDQEGKDLLEQATRTIRVENEESRQKAEFAIQRMEKMDEIIRDLNRRNAELETRIELLRGEVERLTRERDTLGQGKAGLEEEMTRRLGESNATLRGLGQELAALKEFQTSRLGSVEDDLLRERARRLEAEGRLREVNAALEREGKLVILQGAPPEDLERCRGQLHDLGGQLGACQEEVAGVADAAAERDAAWETLLAEARRAGDASSVREGDLERCRGQLHDLGGQLGACQEEVAGVADAAAERDAAWESLLAEARREGGVSPVGEGDLERCRGQLHDLAAQLSALEEEVLTVADAAAERDATWESLLEGEVRRRGEVLAGLADLEREVEGLREAFRQRLALLEAQAATRAVTPFPVIVEIQGPPAPPPVAGADVPPAWSASLAELEGEVGELEERWRRKLADLEAEVARLREVEAASRERERNEPETRESLGRLQESLRRAEEEGREREAVVASLQSNLLQATTEGRALRALADTMREAVLENYRAMADLHRKYGKRGDAEKVYLLILKEYPEDAATYEALADLYQEMGQKAKARSARAKAAERAAAKPRPPAEGP